MEVGSIYSHKNFEFEDGNVTKKLLIVLSSSDTSKNIIACLTTSQERPPERKIHPDPGCQGGGDIAFQEHYYFLKANTDFFEKDTWVLFGKILEFTRTDFLKDSKGESAVKEAVLKDVNVRALLNCVLKSFDITTRQQKQLKAELKIQQEKLKR